MASHASALIAATAIYGPYAKPHAPACYFFQLLLLVQMLIVDETSWKHHSLEVLPTDAASILFLVQAASVFYRNLVYLRIFNLDPLIAT